MSFSRSERRRFFATRLGVEDESFASRSNEVPLYREVPNKPRAPGIKDGIPEPEPAPESAQYPPESAAGARRLSRQDTLEPERNSQEAEMGIVSCEGLLNPLELLIGQTPSRSWYLTQNESFSPIVSGDGKVLTSCSSRRPVSEFLQSGPTVPPEPTVEPDAASLLPQLRSPNTEDQTSGFRRWQFADFLDETHYPNLAEKAKASTSPTFGGPTWCNSLSIQDLSNARSEDPCRGDRMIDPVHQKRGADLSAFPPRNDSDIHQSLLSSDESVHPLCSVSLGESSKTATLPSNSSTSSVLATRLHDLVRRKADSSTQDLGGSQTVMVLTRTQSRMAMAELSQKLTRFITMGDELWDMGYTLGMERLLPSAYSSEEVASPGDSEFASESKGKESRNRCTDGTSPSAQQRPLNSTRGSPLAKRLASTLDQLQGPASSKKAAAADEPRILCQLSKPHGVAVDLHGMQSASSLGFSDRPRKSVRGMLQNLVKLCSFSDKGPNQRKTSEVPLVAGGKGRENLGGTMSVPRGSAIGASKILIRELVLAAAQAVGMKDQASSGSILAILRQHAKKGGNSTERVVYCMLNALRQRAEGTGQEAAMKRFQITIKDMENAHIWYYTAFPALAFTNTAYMGIVLPKLLGKSHVHIVNMAEVFNLLLPKLMRILHEQGCANQARHNQEQGGGASLLKSFRVTNVKTALLGRPGRAEFETLRSDAPLQQILVQTAQDLGIELSFRSVWVKDDNLEVLRDIPRIVSEALVVNLGLTFKVFIEDAGMQDELMRCLLRLEPEAVCLAEESVDANGGDFDARVMNLLEFMWNLYEAHDAAATFKDTQNLRRMERMFWNHICCVAVACERQDRRFRPAGPQKRTELFEGWGFRQEVLPSALMSAEFQMLQSYGDGWGLVMQNNTLFLLWRGNKLVFVQSWGL